jgi:hypothetical protein
VAAFDISEVLRASWSGRDHFGWFIFEAPFQCSFLFNEFWDGKSELKVGEREIVFPIVTLLWPIFVNR